MVSYTQYQKKAGQFQKKNLPRSFSNNLFSSKQVYRKFPIQAAVHIALDGALVGVLAILVIMSSVVLHSQYLWTKSFNKLEITRELNRRILESTSILEGYLLKNQKLSRNHVPTKAEDLIYVERPSSQNTKSLVKDSFKRRLFKKMSTFAIKSGY